MNEEIPKILCSYLSVLKTNFMDSGLFCRPTELTVFHRPELDVGARIPETVKINTSVIRIPVEWLELRSYKEGDSDSEEYVADGRNEHCLGKEAFLKAPIRFYIWTKNKLEHQIKESAALYMEHNDLECLIKAPKLLLIKRRVLGNQSPLQSFFSNLAPPPVLPCWFLFKPG